jgi:hypothetical protein
MVGWLNLPRPLIAAGRLSSRGTLENNKWRRAWIVLDSPKILLLVQNIFWCSVLNQMMDFASDDDSNDIPSDFVE